MLRDLGMDEAEIGRVLTLIKVLTSHQHWFTVHVSQQKRAYRILESLLKDSEVQQFLQVNRYKDVLWFHKESFEQLLWWMVLFVVIERSREEIIEGYDVIQELYRAGEASGYQVERLLEVVDRHEL